MRSSGVGTRRLVAVERAARRGEHDGRVVGAGGLEHVERAADVDVAVAAGVRDRRHDAGLRGEVEDGLRRELDRTRVAQRARLDDVELDAARRRRAPARRAPEDRSSITVHLVALGQQGI